MQLGPSRTRVFLFCLRKNCEKVAKNKCDPLFEKLAKVFQIAKFSLIFKGTDVLPRRLSNFGKKNINFLTI